ncbi:hypothetical protein X777_09634, partial [Ooceraea biroi]
LSRRHSYRGILLRKAPLLPYADIPGQDVVSNIKDDMLEKVFTSFRKRIDFCTNSDGAHFENIYH